jgi:hypothetical protein
MPRKSRRECALPNWSMNSAWWRQISDIISRSLIHLREFFHRQRMRKWIINSFVCVLDEKFRRFTASRCKIFFVGNLLQNSKKNGREMNFLKVIDEFWTKYFDFRPSPINCLYGKRTYAEFHLQSPKFKFSGTIQILEKLQKTSFFK